MSYTFLSSNNSIIMYMNEINGFIGISTSNPIYNLDINGAINAVGYCNLLCNAQSASISNAPTSLLTSNIYSTSIVASNASIFSSNTSVYSSNLAFSVSNVIFPSIQFASNASVFSSNANIFSSNASVFSSNTIVFSSNTSVWTSNTLNIYNLLNSNSSYFMEIVSTLPIPITTSYCNILFDTYNQITSLFYNVLPNNSNIQLLQSGIYLFNTTLNTNLTLSNALPSIVTIKAQKNSVDLLPSLTNITSQGTYSSGNTSFIVNANANDIITFQLKLSSGNSNIISRSNLGFLVNTIKLNSTSSNFITSTNSNTTQLSTSFGPILMNSNLINNNPNIFTFNSNGFYINAAGTYLISSKISLVSSNAIPTYIESYLSSNNVELQGSRFYSYTYDNSNNANTNIITYVNSFTSNSFIQLNSRLINTSATNNVFSISNSCHLSAIQLNNMNVTQYTYSNNSAIASNVNQYFSVIPYNMTSYSNSSNYTLSNTILSKAISGFDLVLCSISYSNNFTSSANCISRINAASNPIFNSYEYISSNGLNTQNFANISMIPSSSTSFIETTNTLFSSNLFYMNNGCRMTILNLDKTSVSNVWPNYDFQTNSSCYMTNSSSFSTVSTLSTNCLQPGSYRVGVYFDYVARCPSKGVFNLQLLLDGVSNLFTKQINTFNQYNQSNNFNVFNIFNLKSDAHIISLRASTSSSSDFVYIQNAAIDIYEVLAL